MNTLSLVPQPKVLFLSETAAAVDLSVYHADVLLNAAVAAAAEYAARIGLPQTGMPVSLLFDAGLPEEGWSLSVTADAAVLRASSVPGANRGLAILLQLAAAGGGNVPLCSLSSAPDCPIRMVMIDLARNFHPYHYLTDYVDMCWLYGVRQLHLHFTDNQSYTLPSRLFPKLSTEGRCYSFDEIAELDSYASLRGVEIVPEIDVPGHSTPFSDGYGDLFGRCGIILQTAPAMEAMQSLFAELCDLFPHSAHIHVGGDEADILGWTAMPECRDYAVACGVDFDMEDKRLLSEKLLANFVDKMADAVRAKGRKPIAWEGFAKCVNADVSRDILMESWENYYQYAPEFLEDGFDIINSSWKPMYVVTGNVYWPMEEVYGWDITRWQPIHPKSPFRGQTITVEPNVLIRGGQLLAWGDSLVRKYPVLDEGQREEQRLVEERAAILSERTWNTAPLCDAETFVPMALTAKELLQKLKKAE